MASSQVEIVSSSPFGCVLRDHNRKERCRESNVRAVQAVFEKNFKELFRDHIHGCISLSSAENSQSQITHVASWVTNEQGNGNRHNLRLLNKNQHHHNNIKNEEPSVITPRQSPVLDRCVTRQAQDVTASTIEKHVNETAEPLLVPSNSNTALPITSMASSCKTKNAQNISAQLENSSVKHNLGASSLVQIWEARLNRSNSVNLNQNQNQSQSQSMDSNSSRTSSGLSSIDNNASPVEEPSTGDSFDEKFDNGTKNEDSLIDWESQSDRTGPGEPPSSSCSRSFDAGESERVRIADIIKRLKNGREDTDDHEHSYNITDSQCREHKHNSTSDQAEKRCFSQVINSPRLRGRQAFNDLLMQIERDKNRELDLLVERQAVSKFSQRGRLQSMLRLRCLQRSVTIQDKCRPQSPGSHVNRLSQGSTIMHLRYHDFTPFALLFEITMISLTPSAQLDSATPRCLHREVLNNSIQLDKSSTSKPQSEDTHCQKVSFTGHQSKWPVNRLTMNRNEDLHEQAKPPFDAIQQKTSLEARCLESLKTAEATTPLERQSENEMAKKQGSSSQQHLFLDSQETAETISSLNVYKQNEIAEEQDNHHQHRSLDLQETIETASLNCSIENEIAEEQDIGDQQHLCLDSQELIENSTSYNEQDENEVTEELEDHYQQYFVQTNYDWFSNISRPRSYWEGLRKSWYQEVLNTNAKNEEIRQLLERGRVSTFLASDFRERMDQLMISRVQMQADRAESQEGVDDEDRMVQVMPYLQKHLQPAGGQGEEEESVVDGQEEEEVEEGVYEEEEDDEEEEEDERSLISHQFHEANNYFNQSSSSLQVPSPSDLMRSWSFQDDNETGNYSDRDPSAFSPPLGPSQGQYYQDTRQSSSSISRPSLVSSFGYLLNIYEMELICDLRGHIEQLQHEMGELRKSILSCMDMQMKLQQCSFNLEVHSVGGEGRNSADKAPWKRSCCICYEMQVDSLLYRCGHMCTCLKCAHELQWGSGKCPICRAPILDVVPAKDIMFIQIRWESNFFPNETGSKIMKSLRQDGERGDFEFSAKDEEHILHLAPKNTRAFRPTKPSPAVGSKLFLGNGPRNTFVHHRCCFTSDKI
ncbi:uncharacterized protein LOC111308481 [Durio zibethinus]|uniref:Uncharacterized protein LOC111308481 n=1 Tax=Durio zibethinus TaxID=66656 RepID=A0A6P6ACD1_DURZI|nr:uncharacterized protein LOC111308481 [Durio zibethinus]